MPAVLAYIILGVVVFPTPVAAQAPASPAADPAPLVVPFFRDVTRAELWSFFNPGPDGGDPDYGFLGNRMTFGVRASTPRWAAEGAFQYIQLLGLPRNAVGPGGLGAGAYYYYSAGNRNAYQFYANRLNLAFDSGRGWSLTGGRMGYMSGAEGESGVPSLEFLKRERLAGRLIGEFEWSIVQRAFDGARLDIDSERWQLSAAALMPTQGGYEESASPTMTHVRVLSAAATFKPDVVIPWSELQAFTYVYSDDRPVTERPDNSDLPSSRADVDIVTVGGAQAGIFPTAAGEADSVVWLALQTGDWYGTPHRAVSLAAELGHRWTALDWQPWVRVGMLYASGDGDPADDRHGTFFQMVPSNRRYALSTTYAQMNVREVFGQVWVYPRPWLSLRADLHHVWLASADDRWYSGSGAIAGRGEFFGYTRRPSGGSTGLGTILEGLADVRVNQRWSLNAYLGLMHGGDVVDRLFAGRRLTFFSLESVLSF